MSANQCRFQFEDTAIGQLKERIYSMSDAEIASLMEGCEIPSPGELDKPGSYIQNTIRKEVIANRPLIWPYRLITAYILPGIRECMVRSW